MQARKWCQRHVRGRHPPRTRPTHTEIERSPQPGTEETTLTIKEPFQKHVRGRHEQLSEPKPSLWCWMNAEAKAMPWEWDTIFKFGLLAIARRRQKRAEADQLEYSRNLGRPSQPRPNPSNPPSRGNASSPSAYTPSSLIPPNQQTAPASPSSSTTSMQVNEQAYQSNSANKNPPFFFREQYAGFIVKGNFMTLAAKPSLVEDGEWLAHQLVEQNRILSGNLKVVQTDDRTKGRPICNDRECPTMSAGSATYTWIDTNRNPINLPAPTYIKHIQTWVAGKIQNEALFPTANLQSVQPIPSPEQVAKDASNWLGRTSGFPQQFEGELKNMYKQMFRCYAHLYWQHWLDFWHLNMHRELNTCFVHFVNVGRLFNLLSDKEAEPMQPLIDLWITRGDLPALKDATNAPTSAGGLAAGGAPTATPAPTS